MLIIGFLIAAPLGKTEEQTDKHQQHMPHQSVDGQEPPIQQQAGRLGKGHGTAQQIIKYHKAVHAPLKLSGLLEKVKSTQSAKH